VADDEPQAYREARALAGYSGTPLWKKLGFKPGTRAAYVNAPEQFVGLLEGIPDGVKVRARLRGPLDLIVCFVSERRIFEQRLPALRRALAPAGMLWMAWPKQASGVQTDITEEGVRDRRDVVGAEAGDPQGSAVVSRT